MKQAISIICLFFALTACVNVTSEQSNEQTATSHIDEVDAPKNEASRLLDPLVEKYPNYKDNEIAQGEMAKSLEEYFSSCVGKPFDFISNLPVQFEEIDQVNGEKATAWFKVPDYSSYGGDKWDLGFRLLVEMTKDEASTLSSGRYLVKGILKKWDRNGRFTGTGFHVSSTIWLGTFIITDATITKQ